MFRQADFDELRKAIDQRYTFTDDIYDRMSDAAADRTETIALSQLALVDRVEQLAREYGLLLS